VSAHSKLCSSGKLLIENGRSRLTFVRLTQNHAEGIGMRIFPIAAALFASVLVYMFIFERDRLTDDDKDTTTTNDTTTSQKTVDEIDSA
jgi:hypothetical protein